ncbi:integrase [Vibrio coralliilyticus]|uniref:Integrase n=1 Tax=Vibrio coralliilyticus TaxID=190893 RepID=A0A837G931_9VIBR|nr:site-specific integrase [Vibrio coralliilyticus]KJY68413.1 integrase [Vibrio coralliilyticus]QOU30388.1 site-specific integrase [Vibrio coralliilyticus]
MNFETHITLSLHTPIPVLVEQYSIQKAQYFKSYLCTTQYRLKRLAEWFSNNCVKDMSPELVSKFLRERQTQVKSGSVRKDASVLRAMLNWLRKDIGLPIPDVFKHVRIPKDYTVRQFMPTDEELHKVIGNLKTQELKDICLLLSETACRRSEILGLRLGDVSLTGRYVQLRETKNGEDRRVPLSRPAMAILEHKLYELNGYPESKRLFRTQPMYLSKAFRVAADEEGLNDFVLHSLRHYRLSKLIQAGHDHMLVAKLSGHKDIRVLNRYVKVDVSQLAATLFD